MTVADQGALFDVTPTRPGQAAPDPALSADRRRTLRQAAALAAGRHPLQPVAGRALRLHDEAGPADDRAAPGRRCGNCWYRESIHHRDRSYAKCVYGAPRLPRVSHSAASDVRAWWPACADHTYGDPGLSPDAARYVPGGDRS